MIKKIFMECSIFSEIVFEDKAPIILIFPNIRNISKYSEYFRIFGRGFRLFIFNTFKKISFDYSTYSAEDSDYSLFLFFEK